MGIGAGIDGKGVGVERACDGVLHVTVHAHCAHALSTMPSARVPHRHLAHPLPSVLQCGSHGKWSWSGREDVGVEGARDAERAFAKHAPCVRHCTGYCALAFNGPVVTAHGARRPFQVDHGSHCGSKEAWIPRSSHKWGEGLLVEEHACVQSALK